MGAAFAGYISTKFNSGIVVRRRKTNAVMRNSRCVEFPERMVFVREVPLKWRAYLIILISMHLSLLNLNRRPEKLKY